MNPDDPSDLEIQGDSPKSSSEIFAAKANSHRLPCHASLLVVDLDGTLVRTDLLYESLRTKLLSEPHKIVGLILRLKDGRAAFKQALAEETSLDVTNLPYRLEILDFIREQRSSGRPVVLATASCKRWAESVAAHLKLFDHVLATEGDCNLKGAEKLKKIQELCLQQGYSKFDYIGDSRADLPIWEQSARAMLAAHNSYLLRRLRVRYGTVHVFEQGPSFAVATFRALRPHQWSKNLLLFVPLILAHRVRDFGSLVLSLIAFTSFSLFASGVYVLNDFADIEFDRKHYRKRHRPLASGHLPLVAAIPVAASCLLGSVAIAYVSLPMVFLALLVAYFVITSSYSLVLKRVLIGDVIVLAGLYALRVFAGGVACGIPISDWLMTFSLFIFVSLGFLKRYSELIRNQDDGLSAAAGRGYEVEDASLIEAMGVSSGVMSVVVLALYLQSDQVRSLYRSDRLLWLLCPLLLYWLCRAWILARRRRLSDDPIVFALTDPTSLGIVLTTAGLLAISSIYQ